jgi:hypothetical protein
VLVRNFHNGVWWVGLTSDVTGTFINLDALSFFVPCCPIGTETSFNTFDWNDGMFVASVHTSDGCGGTTSFVLLTCVALNGTEVLTPPLDMHTMSVTNGCICSHCSAQTFTIATRITTTRVVVTCVVEGFRVNLVVAGSEQLLVVATTRVVVILVAIVNVCALQWLHMQPFVTLMVCMSSGGVRTSVPFSATHVRSTKLVVPPHPSLV